MPKPDDYEHDRLSPETVHQFRALLTIVRMQEQMAQRCLRRQGAGGDLDVVRERLAIIDARVMQLAEEIATREDRNPPAGRQDRGDPPASR